MGPAFLAFAIAALVGGTELVTSKYPRTAFVLTPRKCWALYAYCAIYGIIAFIVTLLLGSLVKSGTVQLSGVGLNSPWAQAVAVGLTVKAFLHIRLFSATVGSQTVPIGVETIVQLFEPWLLRTIDLDEFNGVREFLDAYAKRHNDLDEVRKRIKANIPTHLSSEERAALVADIDAAPDVIVAMERYLKLLGPNSFRRVFG